MTALSGRVIGYKTKADGTPRITIELDCELSEASALLPVGAEVGLARLTHQPLPEVEPEAEKPKGGELAKLAGRLCENPEFRRWLRETVFGIEVCAEEAARFVRHVCGINSRSELDHNAPAAAFFHEKIRRPFLEWQNEQIYKARLG